MKILVTGGSGFIGSALVLRLIEHSDHEVVNLDALTYAANPQSLQHLSAHPRYQFVQSDIRDSAHLDHIFAHYQPLAVIHLAAESHVDRSLDGPWAFVDTNINGTFHLLQATRKYFDGLTTAEKETFRFHHVSTDEVFGSLSTDAPAFDEQSAYRPNSPYAASKAASDHLVRAWSKSYSLPILLTNCSNNYGPRQFPEKLIPLMIMKALAGESLPVYGDGSNIRDWLYVEDHARALVQVLQQGKPGETYAIGAGQEKSNIELVQLLCQILDQLRPDPAGPYHRLIQFVADRPGHDFRYAINDQKIRNQLGFCPQFSLEQGLQQTVEWYLDHPEWWQGLVAEKYPLERLGLGGRK